MLLADGRTALTYCMNIHPAETWEECREALEGPTRAIKQTLAPDTPFAVGLRFSHQALTTLRDRPARDDLKHLLQEHDFLPVTVNGFPYGPFHGIRVKEDVYLPDWRTPERLDYTRDLATLMADIAVGDDPVSLSTVPGAFKPLGLGNEALMARNFVEAAAHCVRLRDSTGKSVQLAIEPEPYCFLETIEECVAFFDQYLYGDEAIAQMAELTGISREQAAEALRRHLGLCYDVCHAAVEFEDPGSSIDALRRAAIPVHKLQLSAAIRVEKVDGGAREALGAYAEPTYLHQVVSNDGHSLSRISDLPEALSRGAAADGEEWRIHFHVPIFVEHLDHFGTTQGFLADVLALHRQEAISPHLEVETYTWGVLPEKLRAETMEQAITRELTWVLDRLQ